MRLQCPSKHMRAEWDTGQTRPVCCTYWQVQEPGQGMGLAGVIWGYSDQDAAPTELHEGQISGGQDQARQGWTQNWPSNCIHQCVRRLIREMDCAKTCTVKYTQESGLGCPQVRLVWRFSTNWTSGLKTPTTERTADSVVWPCSAKCQSWASLMA